MNQSEQLPSPPAVGPLSGDPAVVLRGKRVLVVEDELLLAMAIEEMLESDLGMIVAATAGTLDDGLAFAEKGGFDVALLDVNLNEERSYPIADLLREKGVPFAFATGYETTDWGGDAPRLGKPYDERAPANVLIDLLT